MPGVIVGRTMGAAGGARWVKLCAIVKMIGDKKPLIMAKT
jgi:hypothetical protein